MRDLSFDVQDVLDWIQGAEEKQKANGSLGGFFPILFWKILRWAVGKGLAANARSGRMGANTSRTWE